MKERTIFVGKFEVLVTMEVRGLVDFPGNEL